MDKLDLDAKLFPGGGTSIYGLFLPARITNCLVNKFYPDGTYEDIVRASYKDFLHTPNFGRKSLKELNKALEKYGLHTQMSEADILNYRPEKTTDDRLDAIELTLELMIKMLEGKKGKSHQIHNI